MPTEVKAQNTTTLASVKAIYDAADQANTLLDGMQAAATAAGTTLDGIYQDAADAQTAADDAQASADSASEYAARALGNLSTVQNITETLNWITAHGTMTLTSDVALDPTHVYFVVDAGGDYVVGGTHYSIVSEPKDAELSTYYELTVNESVQNYVATHIAVDSEGLWLIPEDNATIASSSKKILIAVGGAGHTYETAGTYIIQKVNGTDTVFAKFTANGATMQAEGSTQIAHLGYGSGTDSGGGASDAPYYVLGAQNEATEYNDSTLYNLRDVCLYNGTKYFCVQATFGTWDSACWVPAIGNYSASFGNNCISAGYVSVAEGRQSVAQGLASHAEGTAWAAGDFSHAESGAVIAEGDYSHAEGDSTAARGTASHAQNLETIAASANQTALGKYNITDAADTYAAIIGNGTADNARSNALTVDWSGNVEAAGDVTDGSGNTLSALSSALSSLITTQTYDLGAVSYTAGTIGTVGTTKTTSITKSGYTPIAVSVEFVSTSVVSFIPFMNTGKDTVYTHYVRRQSTAYSTTYHAYLYVTYLKN